MARLRNPDHTRSASGTRSHCGYDPRNVARSTSIDLYYKRSMGNRRKPQPREINASLRKLLASAGQPSCANENRLRLQRSGNLVWPALIPLGEYAVAPIDSGG